MAGWSLVPRALSIAAACVLLMAGPAWAEGTHAEGTHADGTHANGGNLIFKSANCVGCHKWSGVGGGGYGGAAANLRATQLTPEQIQETVRCGRPGTGMPHFQADAYADGRCYGLKKSDLPSDQMPPEPDHPLRPEEIKAVAGYVVTSIKGKGAPNLTDCQAFFGTASRVCDIYQPADGRSGAVAASSHGHLKVDAAQDANAPNAAPGK